MNHSTTSSRFPVTRLLSIALAAGIAFCGSMTQAAVPGIAGAVAAPSFDLVASPAYTTQPDGQMIYSWGYGCNSAPARFLPFGGTCPTMQLPGPTLIVSEGDTVSVTLTNSLPAAAGNTSIVFPGFQVSAAASATQPATCTAATAAPAGVLTTEAATNCSVTYTFVATTPGTYSYYSGTQSDLQIEMGLFGALIVVPAPTAANGNFTATCAKGPSSLAATAYDHNATCYDREYLFQFSEMNLEIHQAAEAAVAKGGTGPLNVATEPNQPEYYLVNGRSMPDLMDTPYATSYPHQPYNANPHMHPGELMLMRVIGQGRRQHPFHFHGNHARVLARDGNLLLSATDVTKLAGPLLFTTPTVPGQTQDQIFTWTGQGLNWDVYGLTQTHTCNGVTLADAATPSAATTALLKSNNGFDPGSHEYCLDHGKPIPVLPPDPNVVANGLWYGGTPFLGLQNANPTPLPPGAVKQNADAGYAYMWHSHNEREITTNNVFPGGMMMMMIIDPPTSPVDETQ
jgi:FtsP/CotA-like multicopper oxidase with cupredoxin domain